MMEHVLITGAWRLGRRPQLDGLRGAAILMVLACHVGSYDLPAGARPRLIIVPGADGRPMLRRPD